LFSLIIVCFIPIIRSLSKNYNYHKIKRGNNHAYSIPSDKEENIVQYICVFTCLTLILPDL
jgi:hypothetical protein